MATKKRIEQLETLLDWERETGRLPETSNLFNRKIGENLYLREIEPRAWAIETVHKEADGIATVHRITLSNAVFIQLGLTILEASKTVGDRFIKDSI